MPSCVFGLHGDPVNTGLCVPVLDGLICHSQVAVDGPNTVAQIHLVFGIRGVPLNMPHQGCEHLWLSFQQIPQIPSQMPALVYKAGGSKPPFNGWMTSRHAVAVASYLLLNDGEGDVIPRCHGQHLPLDAQLEAFRGQQWADVLLGTLLLVDSSLADIGDHFPVAADKHIGRYA